jgi:hypothetical protein
MLGFFGAVVFSASTFLVKEMKRGASSEWWEHKILNNIPVLERTGGECCTFGCTITFNSRHTMSFEAGLAILESYAKGGNHFPLIIGFQLIGGFTAPDFVLTKIESQYGIVNKSGRGLHSTVQCEFKQYRVAISTGSATTSGLGGIGSALGSIASAVSGVVPGLSTLSGAVGAVSGAFSAAGGVMGAVNGIPNMLGQVGGKAVAAIPAVSGGTGSLLPGGVRVG